MMQAIQSRNAIVEEAAPSSICAIASGKGGVGKTWFSITLAQAMSRLGARILLFDGDFGLANVDVQLGLNPSRDLSGVIAGRYRLAEATISYADGFDVVAGRSGSGSLAGMSGAYMERMSTAMAGVSDHYDRVVLDLGAGIERSVLRMAAGAGLCLVLTTDEPTALTDAYAFMKLRYQDDPGADIRVVVNMASSESQGEQTFRTLRKACETFLQKTPVLAGVVRQDGKVRDAIRHQTPILTRHPSCDAGQDVERIARAIVKG
jgi:flagellar biosynthesis protein FlhG